jgi:hypothetical protein
MVMMIHTGCLRLDRMLGGTEMHMYVCAAHLRRVHTSQTPFWAASQPPCNVSILVTLTLFLIIKLFHVHVHVNGLGLGAFQIFTSPTQRQSTQVLCTREPYDMINVGCLSDSTGPPALDWGMECSQSGDTYVHTTSCVFFGRSSPAANLEYSGGSCPLLCHGQ